MSGLRDSDAVAEVLRERPPKLDDVAKARLEKRLLEAVGEPRRAALRAPEPPRGNKTTVWLVGGGLAVAAAVGLGFFLARGPEASTRVARMELHSVGATQQSGTIDEGSRLRTGPDEVARIRIDDSAVHLEPSTEVQIEALTPSRMAFLLERGEIRVEFHPRRRGQEGMTIRTAHATVEVVGTVFTVRTTESATEVSVTEGRVRVVPREGAPRFVSAGESTRVGPERRAEVTVSPAPGQAPVQAPERVEDEAVDTARPPTERERRSQSPAQRLARARRLITAGDNEAAAALLRGVVGASDASARLRAQASLLLGDLLQRQGSLTEAAEAYEAAARQGAGHLSQLAIYDLARMQERRVGDRAAARASYRRYLEQSANGPLSGQARQALCRLGDEATCATGQEEPTP